jgi:hypothetical protein
MVFDPGPRPTYAAVAFGVASLWLLFDYLAPGWVWILAALFFFARRRQERQRWVEAFESVTWTWVCQSCRCTFRP